MKLWQKSQEVRTNIRDLLIAYFLWFHEIGSLKALPCNIDKLAGYLHIKYDYFSPIAHAFTIYMC